MNTPTTYGATRQRLIDNGYTPCPATAFDESGYRFADEPGAVICYDRLDSSKSLATVTLAGNDKKLRGELERIVDQHLGSGPIRTASDGSTTRVFRWDHSVLPPRAVKSDVAGYPHIVIEGVTDQYVKGHPANGRLPILIRVDGSWQRGDLLSTRRDKLPLATTHKIEAVFAAVDLLMHPPKPERVLTAAEIEANKIAALEWAADLGAARVEAPPPHPNWPRRKEPVAPTADAEAKPVYYNDRGQRTTRWGLPLE